MVNLLITKTSTGSIEFASVASYHHQLKYENFILNYNINIYCTNFAIRVYITTMTAHDETLLHTMCVNIIHVDC